MKLVELSCGLTFLALMFVRWDAAGWNNWRLVSVVFFSVDPNNGLVIRKKSRITRELTPSFDFDSPYFLPLYVVLGYQNWIR